jgi:addiction module HigA family antidote
MSVAQAAGKLRVSRQTLYRILSGKAAVTPEMALRLGKFCGNGPDLWLRLQERFDLWHAERAIAGDLAEIETAKAA